MGVREQKRLRYMRVIKCGQDLIGELEYMRGAFRGLKLLSGDAVISALHYCHFSIYLQ